jgi:hypothetical protein
LPDGYLQTKNLNVGKFWSALERKMLVYFMVISNILWPFRIFCGRLYNLWSIGNVVIIWKIFHRLGILCQEKSGNPGPECLQKPISGSETFRNYKEAGA